MNFPPEVATCPECDEPATFVLDGDLQRFYCKKCDVRWGLRSFISYQQAVAALHMARLKERACAARST